MTRGIQIHFTRTRMRITYPFRHIAPACLLVGTLFPTLAHASDGGNGGLIFLLVLAVIALYFLPTIIAFMREHPNRWVILALNFFLGATGIVWIGSLLWALHAAHISPTGNDGGESGLNAFVNDETTVRVIHENLPAARGTDVASQLVSLKGLLDSGAITAAEYVELKQRAIQGG